VEGDSHEQIVSKGHHKTLNPQANDMRLVGTLEACRTMCYGPRYTEETMLALGSVVDDRTISLGDSSKVDVPILLSDHIGEDLPTVIRVVTLA